MSVLDAQMTSLDFCSYFFFVSLHWSFIEKIWLSNKNVNPEHIYYKSLKYIWGYNYYCRETVILSSCQVNTDKNTIIKNTTVASLGTLVISI